MQLLRAWERRYGVVKPERTSSGYRVYDEPSIARLRAMRLLVDEGWAPSTAAVRVRALDDAAVGDLLESSGASTATGNIGAGGAVEGGALREAFVEAARTLDEAAVEQVLDQMFSRGSFEQVTDELVMPALVDLGQGWADGRVDVAGEHAAAGAVQRRLGMAFIAAGVPRDNEQTVLVGLPPGARHDLGALAFATTARRAGLAVRYLGADLPVQDWIEAVRRTDAGAVVIGVVVRSDIRSAAAVARAVRAASPKTVIAVGGRRSGSVAVEELGDVVLLPDDLSGAVAALREAMRSAD